MRWEIAIRAQDEAVDLLHDALVNFPPTIRMNHADVPDHLRALGSYLLTLGYVTPQQIILALREQRRRAEQGSHWPDGRYPRRAGSPAPAGADGGAAGAAGGSPGGLARLAAPPARRTPDCDGAAFADGACAGAAPTRSICASTAPGRGWAIC